MGYTHYWYFKKKAEQIENADVKFANAVRLFKEGLALIPKTIKDVPFKLCNGIGEGEPKITDTLICFNGSRADEQDGETFYIALDDLQDFDFCKTCRCAYDAAVCLALLCFADEFGEDFEYKSDGDIESGEEGWGIAKEIFAKL